MVFILFIYYMIYTCLQFWLYAQIDNWISNQLNCLENKSIHIYQATCHLVFSHSNHFMKSRSSSQSKITCESDQQFYQATTEPKRTEIIEYKKWFRKRDGDTFICSIWDICFYRVYKLCPLICTHNHGFLNVNQVLIINW